MKPWKFAKPKGPGFGIARDFYITVLSATAQLPPIVVVINPKGDGGAVSGFGVPLAKDSQKVDIARPMSRGEYALATPDRKTIVKLRVVSKEEAGFDAEPFLRSRLAEGLSPELQARMRATWNLLQLTFETHDPGVYDAARFVLRIAQRLGHVTDGVVSDPICQRYVLPEHVFVTEPIDNRIDARDHVAVHQRDNDCYTMGLRKFGFPELEIKDLSSDLIPIAKNLLIGVSQNALLGNPPNLGDRLGNKPYLEVVTGGLDRAHWEGIPCLELIPSRGATLEECLLALTV